MWEWLSKRANISAFVWWELVSYDRFIPDRFATFLSIPLYYVGTVYDYIEIVLCIYTDVLIAMVYGKLVLGRPLLIIGAVVCVLLSLSLLIFHDDFSRIGG